MNIALTVPAHNIGDPCVAQITTYPAQVRTRTPGVERVGEITPTSVVLFKVTAPSGQKIVFTIDGNAEAFGQVVCWEKRPMPSSR